MIVMNRFGFVDGKYYLCERKLNKAPIMSEKEINQYRLTSMEEPTDEMLAYIMHEVAVEARTSNEAALDRYFSEIAAIHQAKYGSRK